MSAGVTVGQAQLLTQKVLEGLEVRQTWRRNLEVYRTPTVRLCREDHDSFETLAPSTEAGTSQAR